MTTAFVFAGGGSLGAIQVGALRELLRAGVMPDFLVGASVGALNACYFAGRPDADGVAALEGIWRSLHRRDVFPVTAEGVLGLLRGRGSVFTDRALRALVARNLTFARLEDASVPVHVVATSLNGATVQISRGSAVDAVLASSAIPIALPSVRIGQEDLIDAAIAGNTPVLTAAELGATRIIVLQTGYACSMDGPPGSAVARGIHALTLLVANQLERDLRLIGADASVHIAPHLCPLDVSPFDFSRADELITRSAALTRAWIATGGLKTSTQPMDVPHSHGAGMTMTPARDTGPALSGLDPLSFFESPTGPLPGRADIAAQHEGRTYRFVSEASKARFVASPDAYLPEYGGLCAFAMARGKSVSGDARHWAVFNGRLFLNLNADVHARWKEDAARLIARADANWLARAQGMTRTGR